MLYGGIAKHLTISAIGVSTLALLVGVSYQYGQESYKDVCVTKVRGALENERKKLQQISKTASTINTFSDDELDKWLLDNDSLREE